MQKRSLPIYRIDDFKSLCKETDFYINTFSEHLKNNDFIKNPHKHDFYYVGICTKGTGINTIDFIDYEIKPGSVFTISPGQVHGFSLSDGTDGYIIFHNQSFIDSYSSHKRVKEYPFFCSNHNSPHIVMDKIVGQKTQDLFIEILTEYRNSYLAKFQRIHILLELLYINLLRVYLPPTQIASQNQNYLTKLRKLEDLIDANFKEIKSPNEYAKMMFISEKHLNRICKECLNKTTSDFIMDRIMLEAKRLLIHSTSSVSEIAEQLGYLDSSYFARLFKKKCGKTPAEFVASINKK